MSVEDVQLASSLANTAFEEQPKERKHSRGASSMGSDIFTIKPGSGRKVNPHLAPFGNPPVAQRSIGRTILRGIRSLWATRQTEKDLRKNKDLYVKTTIRELVIYLVYITVLCIITFGMTSPKTFYFTSVLRSILTERKVMGTGDQPSFIDIANVDDFWNVMKGPVFNGLFKQQWSKNDDHSEEQYVNVIFENKMLGRPRLRQLRVTNNSCHVHKKFQSNIHVCYAPYSTSKEDRDTFGPQNDSAPLASAWYYNTSAELDGSSSSGSISRYGGGGFVHDLTPNYDDASSELEYLKKELWVDRGTRVVFLDFTVYNANINLFCKVKLTVEFPASGGAVPSRLFSAVKLIRYVTSWDYFVLACEILFVIFTVYYTIEEILEIKRFRMHYFRVVWNILDVLIIFISYVCIAFNLYRQVKVGRILDSLLKNDNAFSDFEFLSYWQTQFDNIIAFTIFLAWIKIFKYVSFNKTMTQLSTTLSRCAKDIFGFSVMFMIIFLAYAQLGYLLFGSIVSDYRSFATSIFSLFRIILGDFNFNAILDVHRVLGPIFFLTYVFFVFFVLLNMFLAIINDTYTAVKNDMTTQKSEFELTDFFKKSYGRMLERLNVKRNRVIDIQNALKSADVNKDGVIEFDEWRRDLKARGYTDAEIENVFSRYDADGDRVLRNEEQRHFQADLIAQENNLDMDINEIKNQSNAMRALKIKGVPQENQPGNMKSVTREEFSVLARRIDRMEYSIGNVVARVDGVLNKLESSDKMKMKRRQTLTKMITTISDNTQLSSEEKQKRLEKIIHDELEENESPGAPVYQSTTSLRRRHSEDEDPKL